VDTTNSQKKSPRNSVKNKRNTVDAAQAEPPRVPVTDLDYEQFVDRSIDLVARVRAAKEVAQRKMEEFGDPSEYEITKIYGQKKDQEQNEPSLSSEGSQSAFEFIAQDVATRPPREEEQ